MPGNALPAGQGHPAADPEAGQPRPAPERQQQDAAEKEGQPEGEAKACGPGPEPEKRQHPAADEDAADEPLGIRGALGDGRVPRQLRQGEEQEVEPAQQGREAQDQGREGYPAGEPRQGQADAQQDDTGLSELPGLLGVQGGEEEGLRQRRPWLGKLRGGFAAHQRVQADVEELTEAAELLQLRHAGVGLPLADGLAGDAQGVRQVPLGEAPLRPQAADVLS